MAKRKPVCLALQGGGSHGAFQWGVLDRLFEDDRIEVTAVTAASAGAMNAAALVTGLEQGGNEGARASLDKLWLEVNRSGGRNVFGSSGQWLQSLTKQWVSDNPLWQAGQTLAMSMSPYAFNPFNLNPLKRVVETAVDFEAVRASKVQMHIAATAVQSGKSRIFETAEITPQVLMASACLPHVFQAVRIDGQDYWDGGYLANPALYPLFEDRQPHDILLLPLNPFRRDDTPQQSADIMDRLNEILFNAPLVAELRSIAFVQKLMEEGRLERGDGWKDIRIHAIPADEWLGDLSLASKMDTEWGFLTSLKESGRKAADQWLENCFERVGKSTTIDLQAAFL
ncbi:patatin-like phospholipase family protein [uncultured Brevundimonas sp.]|uniref:patatin-like phospholipase family protein n=1 Tax=uncultured Brevundimonas sp. TaxID=213418 RepID=UPI002618B5FE|nr:patatin-like phospholipase family protein [uncultured Brevundimonas sp.]